MSVTRLDFACLPAKYLPIPITTNYIGLLFNSALSLQDMARPE